MDQNVQFVITVGTVIGVFLWLRNDINRLDGEISSLRDDVVTLRNEMTSVRESLSWLRGRMGYSEPSPQEAD
ncbi:MAG: hypothetical protein OXG60_02040 [Chloroflexi bacterium]|nr:hypothetical protein [Chloroflexota bacterium]